MNADKNQDIKQLNTKILQAIAKNGCYIQDNKIEKIPQPKKTKKIKDSDADQEIDEEEDDEDLDSKTSNQDLDESFDATDNSVVKRINIGPNEYLEKYIPIDNKSEESQKPIYIYYKNNVPNKFFQSGQIIPNVSVTGRNPVDDSFTGTIVDDINSAEFTGKLKISDSTISMSRDSILQFKYNNHVYSQISPIEEHREIFNEIKTFLCKVSDPIEVNKLQNILENVGFYQSLDQFEKHRTKITDNSTQNIFISLMPGVAALAGGVIGYLVTSEILFLLAIPAGVIISMSILAYEAFRTNEDRENSPFNIKVFEKGISLQQTNSTQPDQIKTRNYNKQPEHTSATIKGQQNQV